MIARAILTKTEAGQCALCVQPPGQEPQVYEISDRDLADIVSRGCIHLARSDDKTLPIFGTAEAVKAQAKRRGVLSGQLLKRAS